MDEEFDINAEYEKLHGPVARKMLFDEDEYQLLRTRILNSPSSSFNNLFVDDTSMNIGQLLRRKINGVPLPFEGIRIISWREWRLLQVINEARGMGLHLYFLKEKENNETIVYAAGYTDFSGGFVLLKHSFFPSKNVLLGYPDNFVDFFANDDVYLYEKNNHRYNSASIAAQLYLGRTKNTNVWRDECGTSLSSNIKQTNNTTNHTEFKYPWIKKDKQNIALNDVSSEIAGKESIEKEHLFFLTMGSLCNAIGYYSNTDNFFYVVKGSMIALNGYQSLKRNRFIEKVCKHTEEGLIVIKNTKCVNATAAACYVTGKEDADYTLWEDSNGKSLCDFYPEQYPPKEQQSQNIEEKFNIKKLLNHYQRPSKNVENKASCNESVESSLKQSVNWGTNTFYLHSNEDSACLYEASGIYDPATGSFLLNAGSLLSTKSDGLKFDYSEFGYYRRLIINRACKKEINGFRLITNQSCISTDVAASAVMGIINLDGKQVWKDRLGNSISYYLRKKT